MNLIPARFRRGPRLAEPVATPLSDRARMIRWARLELQFIYVTNILVMAASFIHVSKAYARLEDPGRAGTAAGILATLAIDLSILMLTRSIAHAKAAGKPISLAFGAIVFLSVISIAGNLDEGFGVAIHRLSGDAVVAAGLYTLGDFQQLDWLSIARVVVFRGTLPIISIALAYAAVSVAATLSEPEAAPVTQPQTQPETQPQTQPQTQPAITVLPAATPARATRPVAPAAAPARAAGPDPVEDRGAKVARQRALLVRLAEAGDAGLRVDELAAIAGVAERTIWRDIGEGRAIGVLEKEAPDGQVRASAGGIREVARMKAAEVSQRRASGSGVANLQSGPQSPEIASQAPQGPSTTPFLSADNLGVS